MNGPYDQKYPANYGQANPGYAVSQQPYSAGPSTVVIQQPNVIQGPRDWGSGVFDCCNDMSVCCLVCFFGICMECKLASDMGEFLCLPLCVPNALTTLRTKMRMQQNIQGSVCNDCVMVSCCGPCTLCQLTREHQRVGNGSVVYGRH